MKERITTPSNTSHDLITFKKADNYSIVSSTTNYFIVFWFVEASSRVKSINVSNLSRQSNNETIETKNNRIKSWCAADIDNHVCTEHFINTCVSMRMCAFGHVCLRACIQACGLFDCIGIRDAPVLNKWPPVPVWVSPRCGWCMDHVLQNALGHIGSIVMGSSLNVAMNLHWAKERFTSSAQPSMHLRRRGGAR